MPDHDLETLPREAAKKPVPTPVLNAQKAVARLREENAEVAASVEKILPRFAMRLAMEGTDVTVDFLLDHARQGVDHLKAPRKISTDNGIHIHRNLMLKDKAFHEMGVLYPKLVKALDDNDREKFWELTDRKYTGLYTMDNAIRYALSIKDHHNAKRISLFLRDQTEEESYHYGGLGRKHFDLLVNALYLGIEYHDVAFVRWVTSHLKSAKKSWADMPFSHEIDKAMQTGNQEIIDSVLSLGMPLLKSLKAGIEGRDTLGIVSFLAEKLEKDRIENGGEGQPWDGLRSACKNIRATLSSPINNDVAEYILERLPELSVDKVIRGDKKAIEEHEEYRRHIPAWKEAHGILPPQGLAGEDPALFRPAAFHAICQMLRNEHQLLYLPGTAKMAFDAAAFFGTEDRLVKYLHRWGTKESKAPLHDLIHELVLPKDRTVDLVPWAEAAVVAGPKMLSMVRFANLIRVPERGMHPDSWSVEMTRKKIASVGAYANSDESKALARLCFSFGMAQEGFDIALEVVKKMPEVRSIPDLKIDGAKFDMPGAVFSRLPSQDYRGLVLGKMTGCCQSVDNVSGSKYAISGCTSEDGGFYVLEDAKGQLIAQTWAWRGKKGEMVFDTLEHFGDTMSDDAWRNVMTAVARELTARQENHDVTRLLIGRSGDTPDSLSEVFKTVARNPVPREEGLQSEAVKTGYLQAWRTSKKVAGSGLESAHK